MTDGVEDWTLWLIILILFPSAGGIGIVAIHYWFDGQRRRSLRRNPLRKLIAVGAEVSQENVIGQHKGYIFNIAWVSLVKRLHLGAFVVHIYYEGNDILDHLRSENRNKPRWSKILFYGSYLQFYFTKLLFHDSYEALVKELDRITGLLKEHDLQPSPKEKTTIEFIKNVDFDTAAFSEL